LTSEAPENLEKWPFFEGHRPEMAQYQGFRAGALRAWHNFL